MTEIDSETAINDYIAQFLLRYFRSATQTEVLQPNLDPQQDIDLLRMYWAISESVRELVQYLSAHRHEVQAIMEFRRHEEDARVRGRFDSRATVMRRLVTGHPTLTVSHEPVRTFESGPNHVLVWVLETAWRLAMHFGNLVGAQAGQHDPIEQSASGLEKIRRFDTIRQAMAKVVLGRRPSSHSVKNALTSRRQLYLLAAQAYRTLQLIEAGDEEAILDLLNDTLLGPLEVWRRYELAVGLAISRALSAVLKQPLTFSFFGSSIEPICRIGGYEVHWQTQTDDYQTPAAEPSEEATKRIWQHYAMPDGSDRPDLVVLDPDGQAVSVVEVKYFDVERNDGTDAIRSALTQLVRYCRGYRSVPEINQILDVSVVAVIDRGTTSVPVPKPFGVPLLVDFNGIVQRDLDSWAKHVVTASPTPQK